MYLTPATIIYLTQLLLSSLFAGYLIVTVRRSTRRYAWLLAGFFTLLSGLLVALGLETSLAPTWRIFAVFVQYPLQALALIFLLQFAYHFPRLLPIRRREAGLILGLSSVYALWELGFALYRTPYLLHGAILYRPFWSDAPLLLLFGLVPLILLRQINALHPQPSTTFSQWLERVVHPQSHEVRALRNFALILSLVAVLNLFTIRRDTFLIGIHLANSGIALGTLLAIFLFAVSYINAQPELTSFMFKLVGLSLITLLATLGSLGWFLGTNYQTRFLVNLPHKRSFYFTPNAEGGYDGREGPFAFDHNLGSSLQLSDRPSTGQCSPALDFPVLFYGQQYTQIYACNDGTITMGQPVHNREYQYRYGAGVPMIMALLLDLDPQPGGANVYVRQEAESILVTWYQIPSFHRPEFALTFQAQLFGDGSFRLSYLSLPNEPVYAPDDPQIAAIWALGATPGSLRGPLPTRVDLADVSLQSGPIGFVQDYFLDYRQQLHELLEPVAWVILVASGMILLIFPLILRSSLVRPLTDLLRGVEQVETGDYTVQVPVYTSDEIGFLTRAFNRLAQDQGNLIATLETRVAERTAELALANQQLQHEMHERQATHAQAMRQQRILSALEAREHLGRELHDSLGQSFGFINVQAQTVQTLIDKRDLSAARDLITQLGTAARQGHAEIRGFILGLRAVAPQGFWPTLQHSLDDFRASSGLAIVLEFLEPWDEAWLSPLGKLNLLRIIQEALNNARRHARASQITLSFEREADQLTCSIADDGCGFNLGQPFGALGEPQAHFGLKTMGERAAELGSQIVISSAPGQGTRVRIDLPITVPSAASARTVEALTAVLVDDHPMFLEGLTKLLTTHGMHVLSIGVDGIEAQDLALRLRPDLIVMDLHMPHCDGIEATRRIKASWPEARIVVLTVTADEAKLFEALQAGAAGYLLKSMQADEFFRLLAGIEQGAPPIAPELAQRITAELAEQIQINSDRDAALSEPQHEILALIGRGLTYREVARQINLSEASVKYHMKQILERLHLANKAQARSYAQRSGLVTHED